MLKTLFSLFSIIVYGIIGFWSGYTFLGMFIAILPITLITIAVSVLLKHYSINRWETIVALLCCSFIISIQIGRVVDSQKTKDAIVELKRLYEKVEELQDDAEKESKIREILNSNPKVRYDEFGDEFRLSEHGVYIESPNGEIMVRGRP